MGAEGGMQDMGEDVDSSENQGTFRRVELSLGTLPPFLHAPCLHFLLFFSKQCRPDFCGLEQKTVLILMHPLYANFKIGTYRTE